MTPTTPNRRRWWWRAGLGTLAAVLAAAGYVLWLLATDNFHTVAAGHLYRSGQMDGPALARAIQRHGIRCVINLRGADPAAAWYRAETNTTGRLGVAHLDFALSAGREVGDAELDRILAAIRAAPGPVLIHCNGGADRSALIAALYDYTVTGRPADAAVADLNFFYGHIPHAHWRYSIAMDRSYWRYVNDHPQASPLAAAPGGTP